MTELHFGTLLAKFVQHRHLQNTRNIRMPWNTYVRRITVYVGIIGGRCTDITWSLLYVDSAGQGVIGQRLGI